MDASTRPPRTLPKALVLLLALAITTGWGDAAAQHPPLAGSVAAWSGPTVDHGESLGDSVPGFSSVVGLQERAPELVPERVEAPEAAKAQKAEKPAKVTKPARVTEPAAKPTRPTYAGVNHFWIPSLGISKRVHLFECSRQRPPDNYMYRWGCAGENNVYIMGHAYSVMKPLHDAFVRDRLRVGMVAIYANANGKVTKYRVTEWRVVDPVDSHWAIADQPVPSMTLQTCVGPGGRYRLNVRLIAVS